jgi:murein DD-endopeptidase MepM/ murein hydrolase activator NlpD
VTLAAGLAALALTAPASADTPRRDRAASAGDEETIPVRSLGAATEDEAVFPVDAPADYGAGDAGFGAARSGHVHEGQDMFAPAGTTLFAVRDGVLIESGSGGGRGNYIALYSPAQHQTYVYMHMQAPSPVKQGSEVQAGDRVGRVGCTGSCWGDHLHFEVRLGRGAQARAIDPLPFLRRLRRN